MSPVLRTLRLGYIASITDAQQNTTTYQYDVRGNRTAVIDPINSASHPTTFSYDVMNRLTGITYPDGSSVSFGYDYRGRRTSVTDQNNRTTTYGYDDADRLTSVTDSASHTTSYGYDTENNLTASPMPMDTSRRLAMTRSAGSRRQRSLRHGLRAMDMTPSEISHSKQIGMGTAFNTYTMR